MSKIVKNITGSPITVTDVGVTIPASSNYTIPSQDYLLWGASSNVITFVGSGDLVINDGSQDLSISDGTSYLKGYYPHKIIGGTTGAVFGNTGDALKVILSTGSPNEVKSVYDEINAVSGGPETNLLTATVPAGKFWVLNRCEVSGTNIADYRFKINTVTQGRKYTHFCHLSETFDFVSDTEGGLTIAAGDVVLVTVKHGRPSTGDFSARLQYAEGNV